MSVLDVLMIAPMYIYNVYFLYRNISNPELNTCDYSQFTNDMQMFSVTIPDVSNKFEGTTSISYITMKLNDQIIT